MIVVGIAVVALILMAFAGGALGDSEGKEPSGFFGALLFILLLVGIVAKQHKAKQDEEF